MDQKMDDTEKGKYELQVTAQTNIDAGQINDFESDPVHRGKIGQFIHSFKPLDLPYIDEGLSKHERAIVGGNSIQLQRKLTNRHLQLIGIGGSIGAGLFISSGQALHFAGPAGLLIGYLVVGVLVFATMMSLAELAVRYPSTGAFSSYNTRLLDRSVGFALGVNYVISWLTTLPNELIASAVTLNFWSTDNNPAARVNPVAWVILFYCLIIFINLFGIRGYGEFESFASICKVLGVVGFIIVGIVVTCGGGPDHEFIGGKYWHDPGPFANGAKGVFKAMVMALYAFSGVEFASLAAAETKVPRTAVPKAARLVAIRIALFYIVSVIIVGFLVPYNEPALVAANGASASPFVIAIRRAGIKALPSILNAIVIIAVLSVANATVFGSTRALATMAAQGHAPRFLMKCDKMGRPVYCLAIALLFGLLCFLVATPKYGTAFTWLSALGGMSVLIAYFCVNLCCLRNQIAMKHFGLGRQDMEFTAPFGPLCPILGASLCFLVFIMQLWVCIAPMESENMTKGDRVSTFFQTWLSFVIFAIMTISHKIYTKDWMWVRIKDIDVFTGTRIRDPVELRLIIEAEKAERAALSPWRRFVHSWC